MDRNSGQVHPVICGSEGLPLLRSRDSEVWCLRGSARNAETPVPDDEGANSVYRGPLLFESQSVIHGKASYLWKITNLKSPITDNKFRKQAARSICHL